MQPEVPCLENYQCNHLTILAPENKSIVTVTLVRWPQLILYQGLGTAVAPARRVLLHLLCFQQALPMCVQEGLREHTAIALDAVTQHSHIPHILSLQSTAKQNMGCFVLFVLCLGLFTYYTREAPVQQKTLLESPFPNTPLFPKCPW